MMPTLLINTRPKHRGQAIRQMTDITVIDLPLLDIQTLPMTQAEASMMRAWLDHHYDALVVTSVESARRALEYLDDLNGGSDWQQTLPDAPIVAVGSATAKVLTDRGLPVILPKIANNEGMLAMTEIQALTSGSRLLIWRGVGGRKLLNDTLKARGVKIDVIRWYERFIPANLVENFQQNLTTINETADIFVIISSEMAYQAWRGLSHHRRYRYLALGERLKNIIRAHEPDAMVDELVTLEPDEIRQVIHQYSLA